jgi:hypothetical protein
MAAQKLSRGMPPPEVLLMCALGWVLVYLAVGWRLFSRRDL